MHRHGKTSAGKQRWRCPQCCVSTTRKDPAARHRQWRKGFWRWLDRKARLRDIAADLRISRSTLYRRFCVFLDDIPAAPSPASVECLLLDGFWLRGGTAEVVLIASRKSEVVSFAFAAAESRKAWGEFVATLPPPRLVVTDGHPALLHAIAAQWPDIPRQRCLRHISEEVRKKLWSRRDSAGRELDELREELTAVRNTQQRQRWLSRFARWQRRHAAVLEERVPRTDRIGRRYHRYAHPRLRAACAPRPVPPPPKSPHRPFPPLQMPPKIPHKMTLSPPRPRISASFFTPRQCAVAATPEMRFGVFPLDFGKKCAILSPTTPARVPPSPPRGIFTMLK